MKQLKSFDFTDAQRKKLASIILKLDKEKQDILVSGDNIATINGRSLLNGGNISIIKTGIFSIVTELPTNDIDKDKIYLVPSKVTNDENKFSEYIYTDNGWEKLGTITAEVDLSNYVQHTDVVTDTTNGLMLASDKQTVDSLPQYILGNPFGPNDIFAISTNKKNIAIRCACKKIDTNDETAAIFEIPGATQSKAGVMSAPDKVKLDGIEEGAQVNTIESVSVNGTPLEIANKGVNIPNATTSKDGMMSKADKTKLDSLENYTLPAATTTTLGGVKVLENISSDNDISGINSIKIWNGEIYSHTYIKYNSSNKKLILCFNNPIGPDEEVSKIDCTDFIKDGPIASITENGVMSKEDKAKLDSQPTIKASDATGVTDDDYVVIKKSELDSILSRLSALESKA